MIRKLLVVAAAAAIPMSAVAVGAVGSGVAGAGTPASSNPITCALAGHVAFASPGLSHFGSATPNKTSTTATSGAAFTGAACGANGTNVGNVSSPFADKSIVIKNTTKCSKTIPNNPIPGCVKGDYVTDQASGLTTSGPSLKKAIKKGTFVLNGISLPFKTSVAGAYTGCGGAEQGFQITGTVKNKAFAYTTFALTICLGDDSGTGTTNNFANDIVTALASTSGPTITSAEIDPAYSSLAVS